MTNLNEFVGEFKRSAFESKIARRVGKNKAKVNMHNVAFIINQDVAVMPKWGSETLSSSARQYRREIVRNPVIL